MPCKLTRLSSITLIVLNLLSLFLSPIQASSDPHSDGSIASLAAKIDLETRTDLTGNTVENGSSRSVADDVDNALAERGFTDLHRKVFSAVNFDGKANLGYNISIPGNTCETTVIGDWENPSGALVPNATLGDIYNAMNLPSAGLINYTLTRALALQEKLNTTLTDVICAPPASANRGLLFRYDPRDVEGFWTAFILGGSGVGFIGFFGLREAIIPQSMGNITVNEEVWILAATALAQYIVVSASFRLQHLGYFSKGEAFVLNAFIAMGEGIASSCRFLWDKTCAAPGAVKYGILRLAQATVDRLQSFEPRSLGTGGGSSLDLVGQDIEQGRDSC